MSITFIEIWDGWVIIEIDGLIMRIDCCDWDVWLLLWCCRILYNSGWNTSWFDGKPWNEFWEYFHWRFARLAEECGLIPLLHIDELLWWETWKELREYFHGFIPLLYRIRLVTHVWLMIVVLRAWLVDIAWYRNWRYLCRIIYTYHMSLLLYYFLGKVMLRVWVLYLLSSLSSPPISQTSQVVRQRMSTVLGLDSLF